MEENLKVHACFCAVFPFSGVLKEHRVISISLIVSEQINFENKQKKLELEVTGQVKWRKKLNTGHLPFVAKWRYRGISNDHWVLEI